jgi:TP901 family phage tail tape measure protein
MSEEYKDLASSTKDLEKMLDLVNKAISIYTTKVRADGTMDIKTARELQEIYKELAESSLAFSDAENKRNDPIAFKRQYKFLTDENSLLHKSILLIEQKNAELEKQEKILEKTSKLSSFIDSDANTTGIKSNARIKKAVSTYTDKELRLMIKPTGKKGTYTRGDETRLENAGLKIEDAQKLLKLYEAMDSIATTTETTIKNIKSEIKATEKVVAEENEKVQTLLTKGVKSSFDGFDIIDGVERVSPTLSNLIEEAERAKKSVIDLKNGVKENSNAFKGLTKTLLNTRVVLNVLRRIYEEAVRTVQEMDKALTGMTAVTGQTREEVLALIPELKDLAQQTSSTMTEVAELTTEYLRQGRTLQDSMNLARETAKAAKIAEISVTDSLTYMTSAINGFNLSANDAAHVSDVFAKVAVGTATDYEQLAVALSKVSAQANLAGMSMEYTTALLAKGIETTQEAPESIGTALKTIIARMRELTDYNKVLEDGTSINKVEAALKSAGIELRSSTGSFRDLQDVFNELGPKWQYLNSMQQQAIAQAVAGTRQQSRFVAIMQD